jgi:hypothetical protein
MVLNPVTLDKTDTCLTYVLKRRGLDPKLCTYQTFHEFFNQYQYARYRKKMEIGDIVLWDKNIKWEWLPWSINGGVGITWKSTPVGFHFAIYEGDGMFTDCSRTVVPPHPTLRLRKINELQKNPDWVLVLDELNQTELSNNGSSI